MLRQGFFFTLVSGCGWCLDFGVYFLVAAQLGVPVAAANLMSSFVGVTFVFAFATRHIFANRQGRWPLRRKYVFYLAYEACLVSAVSLLAQGIFAWCTSSPYAAWFSDAQWKLAAKCLVTPVTLTCNFFVMRWLTERI